MAQPDTETAPEATARRGRPRPDSTVQRDDAALSHFTAAGADGLTREQLAVKLTESTGTEVKPSEAYLSIYRLSRREPATIGKVRRDGKTVWLLTEHVPAPAEAPAE